MLLSERAPTPSSKNRLMGTPGLGAWSASPFMLSFLSDPEIAYVEEICVPAKWLPNMQKCSFSMKSSSSGRILAATKLRHFLQVDLVSRLCKGLKLRLKRPCSEACFGPLGGVFMAISRPDHATGWAGGVGFLSSSRYFKGYGGWCPKSRVACSPFQVAS